MMLKFEILLLPGCLFQLRLATKIFLQQRTPPLKAEILVTQDRGINANSHEQSHQIAMGSKTTPTNEGRNATNPNKVTSQVHQKTPSIRAAQLYSGKSTAVLASTQLFQTENSKIPTLKKDLHYITAFKWYGFCKTADMERQPSSEKKMHDGRKSTGCHTGCHS